MVSPENLLLEASEILRELQNRGVQFEVLYSDTLKVRGIISNENRQKIKLWKMQIIEILSPKCLNCESKLNLIQDSMRNSVWVCPMGCGTQINTRNH